MDNPIDEKQLEAVDEALTTLQSRHGQETEEIEYLKSLLTEFKSSPQRFIRIFIPLRKNNDEVVAAESIVASKTFQVTIEEQIAAFDKLNHEGKPNFFIIAESLISNRGVISDAAWSVIGMQKIVKDFKASSTQDLSPDDLSSIEKVHRCDQALKKVL